MFFHRSGGGVSWLLVGLGNPGAKYASTRHNMGFLALDGLADREGFRFNKLRFRAWTAQWKVGDQQVLVMKPQTYMNLSGESVGAAARFYKIPAEHILVISDDIDLPVGKLRLRSAGSAGGHNGLKNIIQHLGSERFPRIKVGVGAKPPKMDLADYVLSRFGAEEQKLMDEAFGEAAEAAVMMMTAGAERAMNHYNAKKKAE